MLIYIYSLTSFGFTTSFHPYCHWFMQDFTILFLDFWNISLLYLFAGSDWLQEEIQTSSVISRGICKTNLYHLFYLTPYPPSLTSSSHINRLVIPQTSCLFPNAISFFSVLFLLFSVYSMKHFLDKLIEFFLPLLYAERLWSEPLKVDYIYCIICLSPPIGLKATCLDWELLSKQ